LVATLAKEKQDTTGFGARLRALRVAAGLTQQQLADRLGMRATNITRLENGGRTPSWETVLRLAKALGVSLDDFKSQHD
jgi:putative transcriptional regulator